MPNPSRQQILSALWPAGLPSRLTVWAILDAARDERIYGAVYGSRLDKCCLYAGELPWQLQMTSPYLVELDRDDAFTAFLIDRGWGNSWGVYLRCDEGIKQLRHHLRGFLRVQDQRGRRLVFRYFDPRVLRVYLPTCLPQELATVFGPVDCFLVEGETGSDILEYRFDGRQLRATCSPIGTGAAQSPAESVLVGSR